MKVVINRCFGGFSLSHKACLQYGKLAGFKLYAFTNGRDKDGHLKMNINVPAKGDEFCVHYAKKPLNEDGSYDEKSYWSDSSLERTDPILVKVVESMGDKANGAHADLSVVEVPDGTDFEIDDYDGVETIHEKHRSWS